MYDMARSNDVNRPRNQNDRTLRRPGLSTRRPALPAKSPSRQMASFAPGALLRDVGVVRRSPDQRIRPPRVVKSPRETTGVRLTYLSLHRGCTQMRPNWTRRQGDSKPKYLGGGGPSRFLSFPPFPSSLLFLPILLFLPLPLLPPLSR